MKVTTLSKRAFERLEPLTLSRHVINTESCILKFTDKGKPKVIKKLFNQDGPMFGNKLYTLEMLSTYSKNLPKSFIIPESLICVSGTIRGFSLPYMDGENLNTILKDDKVPLEKKKYYLSKIGEILGQMDAIRKHTDLQDLFLCDLHSSNFIVDEDNQELGVVDLDSCKIANNKPSVSFYLNDWALLNSVHGKYKVNKEQDGSGYIIADKNSDLYCYAMILLTFLYGEYNINILKVEDFYDYLNYLDYIGVNGNLLECFMNLVSNKDNSNPGQFIETITREQECRAKAKVYEKVKKTHSHF